MEVDQDPSRGHAQAHLGLAPDGRLRHHPAMSTDTIVDLVSRGHEALASGDWDSARDAFMAALELGPDPEASDGLGRTLWWLGDVDGAIDHREQAYASFRKRGDTVRAARIALWLAREYVEAVGNEPAGNGWLARAQGLLRDVEPAPAHGWLDLTLGSRSFDPAHMRELAEAALGTARRSGDAELEASALALLGRALLLGGEFDAGVAALDEAMVAATGGEVTDPIVFGDVCCLVTLACEESGELERLFKWNEVIETFMARHLHGPLISFCGSCGAEFFQAKGDLEMAERCVAGALEALEATGHRSRCIHPAAKLAELRILQGRTEDAERLLIGYEDLPEALGANVAIHRLKGEHALAASLLLRRLNDVGDTVVAVPLLSTLVEVQLAQANIDEARITAGRIGALAERSGHPRLWPRSLRSLKGGSHSRRASRRPATISSEHSRRSGGCRCRSKPRGPEWRWPAPFVTRIPTSPAVKRRSPWSRSSVWERGVRPMRLPRSSANSAGRSEPGRRTSGFSRTESWRCSGFSGKD